MNKPIVLKDWLLYDTTGWDLTKRDLELVCFQVNNWDKMKQYLEAFMEMSHEEGFHNLYSAKLGSFTLIEIQTFLNEIK